MRGKDKMVRFPLTHELQIEPLEVADLGKEISRSTTGKVKIALNFRSSGVVRVFWSPGTVAGDAAGLVN